MGDSWMDKAANRCIDSMLVSSIRDREYLLGKCREHIAEAFGARSQEPAQSLPDDDVDLVHHAVDMCVAELVPKFHGEELRERFTAAFRAHMVSAYEEIVERTWRRFEGRLQEAERWGSAAAAEAVGERAASVSTPHVKPAAALLKAKATPESDATREPVPFKRPDR